MKVIEEFVEKYFIEHGIPLRGKKPWCINYVKMSIYGYKKAGCSNPTRTCFTKKWFPEKLPRVHLYTHILSLQDLKYCPFCRSILSIENFHKDSNNLDNFQNRCKNCSSLMSKKWLKNNPEKNKANTANYRAAKLNRTPIWADLNKIKEIYKNCPEGYHVDHIIPLQGEIISGLHIETNLQYLTETENLRKGNKWPY